MKVCHLTSAHPQEDIRIFFKECVSLADAGYDTYQISCGTTYEKKGVHLIGIGEQPSNRRQRMTLTSKRVYEEALKLDADVYHFHDPELLPYGLKLKKKGKHVIFDSHEDIPAQIIDKTWIPKPARKIVAGIVKLYETHIVKQLDAVVVATPHIAEKFNNRAKKVVVVNNYPRLDDIEYHDTSFSSRKRILCYAGRIDENRGEKNMREVMKSINAVLIIAGNHEAIETDYGVRYVGQLDRKGINELYGQAMMGLCILKPIGNYIYSKPIKVYEYMAAGLPYICSDFPEWQKVARESGAGICVDPEDIVGITRAIEYLLSNPTEAQEMGRKGREYVVNHCSWEKEEQTLLSLYGEISI